MARRYTSSWSCKAIVGVTLVAAGFAIVFRDLDGVAAPRCHLVDMKAWMLSEVLRSVILLCCRALPAYLCDDQGLLGVYLHMLALHWPLLCVMVAPA
jgi:hypothetical protein